MSIIDQLGGFFQGKFWDNPQRQRAASEALGAIKAGLGELAKLGHNYTIVPQDASNMPLPVEYPKMLYFKDQTVNVDSKDHEDRLIGLGWSFTPDGNIGGAHKPPIEAADVLRNQPREAPEDKSDPKTFSKGFIPSQGSVPSQGPNSPSQDPNSDVSGHGVDSADEPSGNKPGEKANIPSIPVPGKATAPDTAVSPPLLKRDEDKGKGK